MERNESQKLVAWMPVTGRRAPVTQLVGAVLIPEGQELPDVGLYLTFLADRVQKMLEREPNPEQSLAELNRQLESAGLLEPGAGPTKLALKDGVAGQVLLSENPAMRMRLAELDVPGKLPKKVYGGSPAAKKLVDETSLWQWAAYVMNRPGPANR